MLGRTVEWDPRIWALGPGVLLDGGFGPFRILILRSQPCMFIPLGCFLNGCMTGIRLCFMWMNHWLRNIGIGCVFCDCDLAGLSCQRDTGGCVRLGNIGKLRLVTGTVCQFVQIQKKQSLAGQHKWNITANAFGFQNLLFGINHCSYGSQQGVWQKEGRSARHTSDFQQQSMDWDHQRMLTL